MSGQADRHTKSDEAVRVMVIAHRETDIAALQLDRLVGIEIVASTSNIEATPPDSPLPDVVLVDLQFAGDRSIEILRRFAADYPEISSLAIAPKPAPYEQIVRAIETGALGFVTEGVVPDLLTDAINQAAAGKAWLPADATLSVLQDVSHELDVTSTERASQLWAIVLGVVPVVGALAAVLSLLWRKYWGHIGVRPVDLAIDPGTRVVDVIIALALIVGVFGPLALITGWLNSIEERIDASEEAEERLDRWRRVRFLGIPFGRLFFNRKVAWVLIAVLMLAATLSLANYASLVVVFVIGPLIGISLLARALNLEHEIPPALRSGSVSRNGLIVGVAMVALIFIVSLGTEAFIRGPDLRTDGVHGILAKQVLGFSAQPVIATNVDGERSPIEVLYLGGNADLYVLYNPCTTVVEFVSVGSTHIEVIDEVSCP